MTETLSILNKDFQPIAAKWFIAENPNGVSVIINPAMGVKQRFYTKYASFLASEGYQVFTYDYLGIGNSKGKSIRKVNADIVDWANSDYATIISRVRETHPNNAIVVIGHSIGGQMIGMTERSTSVDAFVLVASQTPYWKNFSGRMKPRLWFFWNITIPLLTKLTGFFPAKILGLFENLPKQAALQWARWAKTSEYMFNEYPEKKASFEKLNQPALVISFSDDPIAPKHAVSDLMKYFKNLKYEHRFLSPEDIAVRKIGHFGFFKKQFKNTLWVDSVDWLKQNVKKRKREAA